MSATDRCFVSRPQKVNQLNLTIVWHSFCIILLWSYKIIMEMMKKIDMMEMIEMMEKVEMMELMEMLDVKDYTDDADR